MGYHSHVTEINTFWDVWGDTSIYSWQNKWSYFLQSDKYGVIDTSDIPTNVYHVIKFISEAYTLQNNNTIDGQIITAGELVVKGKYIFSLIGIVRKIHCNGL